MLVLTAALGVVFALMQPAEFSLIPVLAGRRIQEANGHVETFRYLGFGIGPVVGGFLFAIGGWSWRWRVDAVTFVAVAIVALCLRVRREPQPSADGSEERAREGIAYLFRDRTLSLVMIVAFSSLLFMSAVWVGELFFVKDVLDQGDTAYGVFLSVWTAGMAIGALFLSKRVAAGAVAAVGLAAATIQGAALALPTLWLVLRLLPRVFFRRRPRAWCEERDVPQPDPRARPRPAARAGLRRLQRDPQRRRARRLRRGRRAGRA